MGTARSAGRVKLLAGLLARSEDYLELARTILAGEWGEIDGSSPVIPFRFTDYYAVEMGEELQRQWVTFRHLVDPETLPLCKLRTNALEQRLAVAGRRQINLDPGYLTLAKLVLATTKDYAHRLYLGRGIYGEVALVWRQGAFQPNSWTYPDYRIVEGLDFFVQTRKRYHRQLADVDGGN